jgi:hypothetical protein
MDDQAGHRFEIVEGLTYRSPTLCAREVEDDATRRCIVYEQRVVAPSGLRALALVRRRRVAVAERQLNGGGG